MEQSSSFFAAVGGHPTFERLADGFYAAVAADPVLRAMYPDDLTDARWRMMAFLEQYWGGPTTYSEQRGHPRLRMRHQPFTIDPDARDRWLACMRTAVDGLDLAPAQRSELWDYLERAAHSMVNAAAPVAAPGPALTSPVSTAASAPADGPALAPAAAPTPSAADPVATLLSILTLEQTGETTFVGGNLPQPGGRVFGGQVLAQALLAAGLTVPAARQPHSMHGYFLRAGDINEPITFSVEALRDGRSFTARRTHAIQNGEPILSMIASFQEEQPGTEFHDTAPDAPHPDLISSALDQLGRIDDPVARFWSHDSAFDVRHVNGAIYLRPQERSSDQLVWMRTKSALPDDQLIHRAIVAAACDQLMLEPVLRRSGLSWLVPGLSIASLDHAMWWHRDVRADEWLLFVQSSPSAGGGRGLGQAKVFDTDGTLVATIAQEGMVRVPQD